jgi:hypothetical protein
LTATSGAAAATSTCVFCGRPGKLTNEHVLPYWLESVGGTGEMAYLRERGGPDYEPWQHARMGKPRDLQAKAPCAACNNGWMNEMDQALDILGPQLVRGKRVRLTKGKQVSLARWAVKFALMQQRLYPKDSRFVIPDEDYARFNAERLPSELMLVWAGYMEPPGKHGGPVMSFGEHTLSAETHGTELLAAVRLPADLAAKGYSGMIRLGHLVVGIRRLGCAELHPFHVPPPVRQWTQIWPALGTKPWPPQAMATAIRLPPLGPGFRFPRPDVSKRKT